MILSIAGDNTLHTALDEIGLGAAIREGGSVLVKVNFARPPEPRHPRTTPSLLAQVIQYATQHEARCAIAEGADGFLQQNIESIGLGRLVQEHRVMVLDLDLEDTDCMTVDDEKHYLPKCLKDYAVRLGIPATSKRPGRTFSNNVKLFVGAVPRRMYQNGETEAPRPRIHADLHKSVASIYRAIMAYAPFGFFVNGGRAMFEDRGEIDLGTVLVGNDALELDRFVLKQLGLEPPEYIKRLVETPCASNGVDVMMEADRMPRHIIRKVRLAHCKRGPSICEKCREMDAEKICLLDICPPRMGEVQRRVIEVNVGGEKVWREFDIVRVFENEAEARAYADENAIEDVAI